MEINSHRCQNTKVAAAEILPIFNPIHSDQDHAINHDKTRSEPNTGNGNSVTGNGNSVRVSVSSDDDTGSEVDIVQEEQEEIT